jgi:MerR family transcriptional regulator, heat shock protein HspR
MTWPSMDASRGIYGIGTAAELVGMGAQNLRLYERRGLIEPDRTDGGARRYSPDDLDRLRRIGELIGAGLNLAGVALVVELEDGNARLRAVNSPTQELDRSRLHKNSTAMPESMGPTTERLFTKQDTQHEIIDRYPGVQAKTPERIPQLVECHARKQLSEAPATRSRARRARPARALKLPDATNQWLATGATEARQGVRRTHTASGDSAARVHHALARPREPTRRRRHGGAHRATHPTDLGSLSGERNDSAPDSMTSRVRQGLGRFRVKHQRRPLSSADPHNDAARNGH